ncbi:MAG: hypothetical protein EZS28_019134 [Streblomastix strix]|uniref:OTU domain-containing protein n=1 Tax=Streblomastix strix TaxID=222440 RepID=A0A5J4VSF0_9EUKA|nr:MAG: hypothetical protein EZS28_019134 [Streblomastix strix]
MRKTLLPKRTQIARLGVRGYANLMDLAIAVLLLYPGQITLSAQDFAISTQRTYSIVHAYCNQTQFRNDIRRSTSYIAPDRSSLFANSLHQRIQSHQVITLQTLHQAIINYQMKQKTAKQIGSKRGVSAPREQMPGNVTLVATTSPGARQQLMFVIFGGLQQVSDYIQYSFIDEDIEFSTSYSGFMNRQKQLKYFNEDEKILLFVDGFKSHGDQESFDILSYEGVITIAFPVHQTTDCTQITKLSAELERQMCARAANDGFQVAATHHNKRTSFRTCGIWPRSPETAVQLDEVTNDLSNPVYQNGRDQGSVQISAQILTKVKRKRVEVEENWKLNAPNEMTQGQNQEEWMKIRVQMIFAKRPHRRNARERRKSQVEADIVQVLQELELDGIQLIYNQDEGNCLFHAINNLFQVQLEIHMPGDVILREVEHFHRILQVTYVGNIYYLSIG